MKVSLLKEYVKAYLAEFKDARVPNQLVSDEPSTEDKDKDEVEDVKEFSGVGAIAGYTAPLGAEKKKKLFYAF
jgi:hypothetical protein